MDSPKHSDVSIIIPVHNRIDTTNDCLQHLSRIGDLSKYNTIVVDDGSSDGTSELIIRSFPQVTILKGDGNLWWTGAISLGMQHAYSAGARYFLWLNDDCRPDEGAIDCMIRYGEEHQIGMVAASIFSERSSEPLRHGFTGRDRIEIGVRETVDVEGIAGYCVLVSRSVYDKISYPDYDRFPHYAGDSAYSLMASRAGFRVVIHTQAKARLVGPENLSHIIDLYANKHRSIFTDLGHLFLSKKSPYYLRTRLNFYILRYGLICGVMIFKFKVLVWTMQYLRAKMKLSFGRVANLG